MNEVVIESNGHVVSGSSLAECLMKLLPLLDFDETLDNVIDI